MKLLVTIWDTSTLFSKISELGSTPCCSCFPMKAFNHSISDFYTNTSEMYVVLLFTEEQVNNWCWGNHVLCD